MGRREGTARAGPRQGGVDGGSQLPPGPVGVRWHELGEEHRCQVLGGADPEHGVGRAAPGQLADRAHGAVHHRVEHDREAESHGVHDHFGGGAGTRRPRLGEPPFVDLGPQRSELGVDLGRRSSTAADDRE